MMRSLNPIKIEPNKPLKFYQNLGYQFLYNHYFIEAEEVFKILSHQHPNHPQGYEGLARVAMGSQQWKFALKRWEKVIELFPHRISARVALGNALIELNHFDQAEFVFRKITKLYPNHAQGYEGLAKIAQRTAQTEQALQYWDLSIQKSQAKSSYIGKARLLMNRVQDDEAIRLIDGLIARYPHDLELLLEKAKLLLMAQHFEGVIKVINQLPKEDQELLPVKILLISALIGLEFFHEANIIIHSLPEFQDCNHQMVRILKTWQSYYQSGIDFTQPKIFGIGLSKTGTTSLNQALNLLNYTAVHFINPITGNVLDSKDFLYFDAFTDISASSRFEELFFAFPNAKFIYTERQVDDWVKSISNYYEKLYGFSTIEGLRNWMNQSQFNTSGRRRLDYDTTHLYAVANLYAHHPNWESAYYSFEKRVKQFFKDQPKDKFLTLNICQEEGWEKLCSFLNQSIPQETFPHQKTNFLNLE